MLDTMGLADAHAEHIAASDYEGWVAYVEGSPLYQAVDRPKKAPPIIESMDQGIYRPEGPRTLSWKELPHAKVHRVEIWMREESQGPLRFRLDRSPDNPHMRFILMNVGAVVADQAGGTGQRRLPPLRRYRVGYWDPRRPLAQLWIVQRGAQIEKYGACTDPFAPRPKGWGLNRTALGLSE